MIIVIFENLYLTR